MFCYQCEQTSNNIACKVKGVCGKEPAVAAMQDLIIHGLKGLSIYANEARKLGVIDHEINVFTLEALFTTVTNVNFDAERHKELILELAKYKSKAKNLYLEACKTQHKTPGIFDGAALWEPAGTIQEMISQGEKISIIKRKEIFNEDIIALQELITYGLKGIASYTYHAYILERENDEIYAFFHKIFAYMTEKNQSEGVLTDYVLKTGEINLLAMELLDKAHTDHFGHPEPTKVRITPIKGKCILVSGHDLKDLEEILKQTEEKDINVYTHGEMLPALAYPEFKKYKHLVGNYGGAWQDQQKEFAQFPGAVLMTTNCLQEPREVYRGRIFTKGVVGWSGVQHVYGNDFKKVINAAYDADGFIEDAEEKYITIGYAHNSIKNISGKIIDYIKEGKIEHIFLVGGCDGAKSGRNYYTEFAKAIPENSIILTLACGKYRFNKLDFGKIEDIPRLLDIGQCNDSYSAIQSVLELSKALKADINDLPMSIILSWYEQKAVAILLTLLYLGMKNIRLGPSLPAFVSPNILKILSDKFNLMPITTPIEDLNDCLK